MRIDQVLPEDIVLPSVATALERGNAGLAVAIVADELDGCDSSDGVTLTYLCVQGVFAARFAGDPEQARMWADRAVDAAPHESTEAQAIARGMRVFACGTDKSRTWMRDEARVIEKLLGQCENRLAARFGHFSALYAWVIAGELESARTALSRLRSILETGNSSVWISARAQVCEAVIEYLDASPSSAKQVLELLQPLTASADSSLPVSSLWWEIAELRHRLGQADHAWDAARRAIDASGVRPSDGRSSFAPGVLTWELNV